MTFRNSALSSFVSLSLAAGASVLPACGGIEGAGSLDRSAVAESTSAVTADAGVAPSTSGDAGVTGAPSFRQIYTDIIAPGCGCHVTRGAASLSFASAATAYQNLVNVAAAGRSCARSGLVRVAPGQPDQSLLLLKLSPETVPCGEEMPPRGDSLLTADQVSQIRAWIAAGASNN